MVSVPDHFDSLEVGILLPDPEPGEVCFANEFAQEMYGYSSSDLMGMHVGSFRSQPFSQPQPSQHSRGAPAAASRSS